MPLSLPDRLLGFFVRNGAIPAVKTPVYTSTGTEVIIGITLTNTDTVARVVSVWLNRWGSSRKILSNRSLAPDETWDWPDAGNATRHILLAGDSIEMIASVAAVVDYLTSVIQRAPTI
jgi:hypothetical protein